MMHMAGADMVIERFTAEHLKQIVPQAAQLCDWPDSAERDARGMVFAAQQHCWTFLDHAGGIVACFGMVASHAQHLTAWAVMSDMGQVRLGYVTRWCRAYLDDTDVRRIDVIVRAGFSNGHQWARLLGFEPEGVQRAFFADGEDMHVYARIRAEENT